MVARGYKQQLSELFFRTLRQSLVLFAIGAIVLLSLVIFLPHVLSSIGQRIVTWPVFLLLLLTGISSHVVQCEALYLRAHKVEPFLLQSICIAAGTAAMAFLLAKP